jgi:ABC-2 type transport system permease protein
MERKLIGVTLNFRYIFADAWIDGVCSLKVHYPYLISGLCLPLALIFIASVASNGALLPYSLVGGVIIVITTGNLLTLSGHVSSRLTSKYQDLIVTTKTGPIDYMMGNVFSCIIWNIPSIILYLFLDSFYHLLTPFSLVMTIITCIFLTISIASISFALSTFVKHTANTGAYITMLSFFTTILAPTFYPYTYLPKYLLDIFFIMPTTSAAVLEQGYFNLSPMLWYVFAILVVQTIAYLLIARYLTRWRDV